MSKLTIDSQMARWLFAAGLVLGLWPWGEAFWVNVVQFSPDGYTPAVSAHRWLELLQGFTQPLLVALAVFLAFFRSNSRFLIAAPYLFLGGVLADYLAVFSDIFYQFQYSGIWHFDFYLEMSFSDAFLGHTMYGPLKIMSILAVAIGTVFATRQYLRLKKSKRSALSTSGQQTTTVAAPVTYTVKPVGFDTETGRPILRYDEETGKPIYLD